MAQGPFAAPHVQLGKAWATRVETGWGGVGCFRRAGSGAGLEAALVCGPVTVAEVGLGAQQCLRTASTGSK